MVRLTVMSLFLTVSGCATTNNSSDQYARAANSWKGANIVEMVKAWGEPNQGVSPATGEKEGVATCEVRAETGVGEHKRTRYHCTTIAHYDSSGMIVEIIVKRQSSCHRRFKDEFESMTRDNTESEPSEIRT